MGKEIHGIKLEGRGWTSPWLAYCWHDIVLFPKGTSHHNLTNCCHVSPKVSELWESSTLFPAMWGHWVELLLMTLSEESMRWGWSISWSLMLCTVTGGLSVLAVGCSWLRPAHIFQPPDGAPLMENCDLEGLDTLAGHGSSPGYPYLMDREPPPPLEGNPPPPYSP